MLARDETTVSERRTVVDELYRWRSVQRVGRGEERRAREAPHEQDHVVRQPRHRAKSTGQRSTSGVGATQRRMRRAAQQLEQSDVRRAPWRRARRGRSEVEVAKRVSHRRLTRSHPPRWLQWPGPCARGACAVALTQQTPTSLAALNADLLEEIFRLACPYGLFGTSYRTDSRLWIASLGCARALRRTDRVSALRLSRCR